MLDLKDKLNLVWKFLILAVFTYGVISVTCCKKSCQYTCNQSGKQISQCCKVQSSICGPNCTKPCCAGKAATK